MNKNTQIVIIFFVFYIAVISSLYTYYTYKNSFTNENDLKIAYWLTIIAFKLAFVVSIWIQYYYETKS